MRTAWILPMIALCCAACQPSQTPTEMPVVVESTGTFVVPTATPDCQHAEGVILDVQRLSDSKVSLHISGLQAREIPYILYSTSLAGAGAKMIASGVFTNGADAQGEFRTDQAGLNPLQGQTSAIWDIRLIHSRGVECTTITLP